MATKVSRLREEYEKRGKVWDGAVYDRAIAKYGSALELDEDRPSQAAILGRALAQNTGTPAQAPMNGGPSLYSGPMSFPGEMAGRGAIRQAFSTPLGNNLAAGMLGGLTAGVIPTQMAPAQEGTGELAKAITERYAPMLGQFAGMGVTLPLLPAKIPAIGGRLGQMIARMAGGAQRLGAYEAISGGAEGLREGGLDRAATSALESGAKGVAIGAGFGAVPQFPKWLGGQAGHSGAIGTGLALAQGESVPEALGAGAVFALGSKLGLPSVTRGGKAVGTDNAPRQAEIESAMMGPAPEQKLSATGRPRANIELTPKERPKVGGREIVPNNQMDEAAQYYREASSKGDTKAFQQYLDRIPTEGKVEPEFAEGLLKYRRVDPPKEKTFEVATVPADFSKAMPPNEAPGLPGIGGYGRAGKIVESTKNKARYYVDETGQYWKLPADQPAFETGISPPHRLMAGAGGGWLPDASGKRNPITSRIYMPAEAVHDAEARAKETAIKAGQRAFDDNGVKSIADFERVGDAWLHLETAKELVADPAMLIATKPGLAEVVRGAKDPIGIVKAAQETRYMMDQLRENDNAVSRKMGLPEIGWVGAYRPKLEKFNLFQKEFGLTGAKGEEAIGLEQEPGGVPPWVRANSPANPRGMSRKPGLEYPEENRADILLANYIHNVIPHTFRQPMIRQARAYADVLDQIGLPGSAANIHDWTNKVLVGQESAFSRNLPALIKGPLRRQSALQSAAVLGSARFGVTQATGQVVAIGRHGVRNMVTGAARSMSDPKWRAWVGEEVVSMRNKRMPHGGASRQDLVDFTSKLKDRNSLREWMLSKVENTLSMWAAGSADARYRSMGGRPFSREAAQYISDEIKDVQGGYARSERAGLFRDPEFGIFLGKFQSYAAGVFSQARSLAAPGSKLGRTGYYKQEYAKSLETESTKARRLVAAAKFVAAAAAIDQAVGYTAWGVNSLLPWARHMGLDDRRAGAKDIPMLPAKWGNELYEATKYFVETGSGRKLRKWVLRWRVPAGIQVDYTVDGLVAWDRGGFYTKYQKDGKTVERKLFDVNDDELMTVLIFGPYASEGGRKYLAGEKRTEPKSESRQGGVQYRTPSYRSPGR